MSCPPLTVAPTPAVTGHAIESYRGYRLHSAFQPIVSLSHRRVVGYEALLRAAAPDGAPVVPPAVFSLPDNSRETVELDRLCRALHVRNFPAAEMPQTWLFLNIAPQVVVEGPQHGPFFERMLTEARFPPHRVVVEILEEHVSDETRLAIAADYYRSLGCLVAIDDFGAGHASFHRIWRIKPDIVKLDRHVVQAGAADARAGRMLQNMIAMLHEAGSQVVAEGVETLDQALAVMDTDVDFVQGYYFGRPTAMPTSSELGANLEPLCRAYRHQARERSHARLGRFAGFQQAFGRAVAALQAGETLEDACSTIVRQPGFLRAFLLDADGFQIGCNVEGRHPRDARFAPLADARGANWFRRPYFRKAIDRPGTLQHTRPYLSITDARLCVTLSIAFERDGQRVVLCGDLEQLPSAATARTV